MCLTSRNEKKSLHVGVLKMKHITKTALSSLLSCYTRQIQMSMKYVLYCINILLSFYHTTNKKAAIVFLSLKLCMRGFLLLSYMSLSRSSSARFMLKNRVGLCVTLSNMEKKKIIMISLFFFIVLPRWLPYRGKQGGSERVQEEVISQSHLQLGTRTVVRQVQQMLLEYCHILDIQTWCIYQKGTS